MSKKYSNGTIEHVKRSADLRLFLDGCKSNRRSQRIKCPFCGDDNFTVEWSPNKHIAHCWSCEETLTNAVDAAVRIDKMDFIQAVEYVAQKAGIFILQEQERMRQTVREAAKKQNPSRGSNWRLRV